MLLIKTYLDKSPIHGIGVFPAEFIRKGILTWEFNPLIDVILTPEQRKTLPEITRKFVDYIGIPYPFRTDNYCLSLENYQYMNHSNDPDTGTGSGKVDDVAQRDIPKGTELTVDYHQEDHRIDASDFYIQAE